MELKHKCCVIMPSGRRDVSVGRRSLKVDFDQLYELYVKPAADEAGFEPVRATLGQNGEITESLLALVDSCPVAIVDLTTHDASIFYELGVRHTLKRTNTLLIAGAGTDIPFANKDTPVHLYPMQTRRWAPGRNLDLTHLVSRKQEFTDFIVGRFNSGTTDSAVHQAFGEGMHVARQARPLRRSSPRYRIPTLPGYTIGMKIGRLDFVTGVDIWVNAESTHMQMSRWTDAGSSALIRYLGARRNAAGDVVEDTIADELKKQVTAAAGRHGVQRGLLVDFAEGVALDAAPGELEGTHGVRRLVHVAALRGTAGTGYAPVSDLGRCVKSALECASRLSLHPRSILLPLIGIETATKDPAILVGEHVSAALDFLDEDEDTPLRQIWFHADDIVHVALLKSAIARQLRLASQTPSEDADEGENSGPYQA